MKNNGTHWSKTELKAYILLLCAKADSVVDAKELTLIQSRTKPEIFTRLHNEISHDDEENSFKKIEKTISKLGYYQMELGELKNEIREVFYVDGKFNIKEFNLSRILDNIIY
ncbi:hypothetical protein LCGC14_1021380 [marine sediment metagenome]|uniref:Tellurite resistance protein TerB n=2 Tax=root TaxID=1 RepID=A0A831QTI7_9FLAO|nr:hypothetical protein [Pricia sp.]HEA22793.1 hypothetical protein [Pricia antarctica]